MFNHCIEFYDFLALNSQPQTVDAVFITHHHYDHISDLGEFLLSAWHNGRKEPLTVYGPLGMVAIVTALFDKFLRVILPLRLLPIQMGQIFGKMTKC